VQEVFAEAQGRDELPVGFTLDAFLGLVQRMIQMELMVVRESADAAASLSAPGR